MFLQLLAVIGVVFAFVASTLAIAAGLYYLSEFLEDHLVLTSKILKYILYFNLIFLALLLLFDSFPWKLTIFTFLTNVIYFKNLTSFPNIDLTNNLFVLTIVLAFLNHYLWFNHFNNPYIPTIGERLDPDFTIPYYPSFTEIAAFFGLCIWLFPFALFISISSNENSLPLSHENANVKQKSLFTSIIQKIGVYLNISFKNSNSNSNSTMPI